MKTLTQIEEALSQEINRSNFSAPLKQIDGFDYVAWNDSNRLANEVFGFMGWSSEVVSCDFVECEMTSLNKRTNEYETKLHKGFRSTVRITVQAWDEEHNIVVTSCHDGVGFGTLTPMGNKNPMDTAAKAAKSDGLSTAFKHFGDYFGLFLYDKETPSYGSETGNSAPSNRPAYNAPSSDGELGPRPSDGQKKALYQIGLTDDVIATLPFKSWKDMVDRLWDKNPATKLSAQQILEKYGLQGTPQPTQRRSYPFAS